MPAHNIEDEAAYRQGFLDGESEAQKDYKNTYRLGFEDGKSDALNWLPIEECPADELVIVKGYDEKREDLQAIAMWPSGADTRDITQWYLDGSTEKTLWNLGWDDVTHFMPLPKPPEQEND